MSIVTRVFVEDVLNCVRRAGKEGTSAYAIATELEHGIRRVRCALVSLSYYEFITMRTIQGVRRHAIWVGLPPAMNERMRLQLACRNYDHAKAKQ